LQRSIIPARCRSSWGARRPTAVAPMPQPAPTGASRPWERLTAAAATG